MSKGRKSSYPERPLGGKRPPAPGEKRNKPSSEHIHGRRKSWLSEGIEYTGQYLDVSPRIGLPWWKSPLMKAERFRKALLRK